MERWNYVPNIPEFVQDIVLLSNIRYSLETELEKTYFDWYVEYLSDQTDPTTRTKAILPTKNSPNYKKNMPETQNNSLTNEDIQNILSLLARVDLKGAEAMVVAVLQQKLSSMKTDTLQPSVPPFPNVNTSKESKEDK